MEFLKVLLEKNITVSNRITQYDTEPKTVLKNFTSGNRHVGTCTRGPDTYVYNHLFFITEDL